MQSITGPFFPKSLFCRVAELQFECHTFTLPLVDLEDQGRRSVDSYALTSAYTRVYFAGSSGARPSLFGVLFALKPRGVTFKDFVFRSSAGPTHHRCNLVVLEVSSASAELQRQKDKALLKCFLQLLFLQGYFTRWAGGRSGVKSHRK